ncbi:MAG: APC family permease [Oscillospiraceae bacterium]|jgi:amino acid transporter|nr:Amino acid transporter [Ruminococcaceae bacterium BL-4]
MAIKVIKEPAPKPGTLGRTELYALAVGQVIGAGVITLIVPAIKMTGYSAWLAYLIAIVMGFIMVLPYVFVSSALRLGGGNYSMLCELAGPTTSGIFAFSYLTQCLSLSLFGTAAAAYLGDVIPSLGGTTARIIVGVVLLTIFFIVNLLGVDIMAHAQKLMTWLLIAALLLFAIVGIFKMKLPIFNFSDPNFLINGWGITFDKGQISGGFTGAILLFVYSCQGYYMTIAYGRDAKNAKRDIPAAMLMTVPTLIFLYVGVAMAGVGVMNVSEYGNSTTLVFAAQRIFPTWLFYFFIIGGPIMALLSTLNSSFAYNAITIGQSCDDGWLPASFGKKNAKGSRVFILAFMYVLGIIPIIFNLSITVITNMVQIFTSFFAFLNFVAIIRLPKKYPEAWGKCRLHVSNGFYYTICVLSLVGAIVVFWKSCLSMTPALAIANVAALLVTAAIGIWRAKRGNIEIHTSVWDKDPGEEDAPTPTTK